MKPSTTLEQEKLGKISKTALFNAHIRARCYNEPPLFAKEIAELLDAGKVVEQYPIFQTSLNGTFVPFAEARYRLNSKALELELDKRKDIDKVLELASGVSPRGLGIVSKHKITYVESDSILHEIKGDICKKVIAQHHLTFKGELLFRKINAFEMGDIKDAIAIFSKGEPIIVAHEALMPYLDRDKLVSNIKAVLSSRPGSLWITSDPSELTYDTIKTMYPTEEQFKKMQEQFKTLGVDNILERMFTTEAQAKEFYSKQGLSIRTYSQKDLDINITWPKDIAPANPKFAKEMLKNLRKNLKVWVMELK